MPLADKLQQLQITFIELGIQFRSEFIVDIASGKSLINVLYIYSIFILYLPFLHHTVINGGTRGDIRLCVKAFQSRGLLTLPMLQSPCTAQSLASFFSIILPLVSVFCPLALSPSISERDTWQTVLPVLPLFSSSCSPTRASHVVCLSSVDASLLSDLRWKDCFSVSAVFIQRTRTLTKTWRFHMHSLGQQVPVYWFGFYLLVCLTFSLM